ncbi:MAG: hypothetical protein OEM38_00410 [Gammaproteobacteria bacterium]|nr:hypothetical protein [Gammaproteobacteria bacterium]
MNILNVAEEEFGIEVEAESSGITETFTIQLCDNKFRSDLGCWITTSDSDGDICFDDYPDFDFDKIIEEAEECSTSSFADRYTEEKIEFNCAINSCVVVMREEKETGEIELVIEDIGHIGSYQTRYSETGRKFISKSEAIEYAKQFRTEDHQDCKGLYAFLAAIQEM